MADFTVEDIRAAAQRAYEAGDIAAARKLIARGMSASSRKSLGRQVNEFLWGDDDPTTMNAGEKLGALLNKGGESLTLGFVGDEAAAAVDAAIGRGSYNERLQFYRDQEEQVEREAPLASLAADIAPALIPGVGIARTAFAAPRAVQGLGRGALGLATRSTKAGMAGGAAGAAFGFNEGEGGFGPRVDNAIDTGQTSGVLSAAIPVAGQAVSSATRPLRQGAANRAFRKAQPAAESLKDNAQAGYRAAERSGAVAGPDAVRAIDTSFRRILTSDGLISPTGRLASSYPKVTDVVRHFEDFAGQQMRPEQMMSARRLLQKAARSADKDEARIGTKMLAEFDLAVDAFVPQLRPANALYRRAMKSEKIQNLMELAASRAGQFTGSGIENAIRTEFRALERAIIKGKEKGWSADEIRLISQIARGGTAENVARGIGRAAPTGVVSAGIGGGVPFMVGNAIGGPGLGAALGGASMGVGMAGRQAATSMQGQTVGLLDALARSPTATLPQVGRSRAADLIEGGLLSGVIANSGQ